MRTIQYRLVSALIARGQSVVTGTIGRTRVKITHPESRMFYFAGLGGSLRIGRTITSSLPAAESHIRELLAEFVSISRHPTLPDLGLE